MKRRVLLYACSMVFISIGLGFFAVADAGATGTSASVALSGSCSAPSVTATVSGVPAPLAESGYGSPYDYPVLVQYGSPSCGFYQSVIFYLDADTVTSGTYDPFTCSWTIGSDGSLSCDNGVVATYGTYGTTNAYGELASNGGPGVFDWNGTNFGTPSVDDLSAGPSLSSTFTSAQTSLLTEMSYAVALVVALLLVALGVRLLVKWSRASVASGKDGTDF